MVSVASRASCSEPKAKSTEPRATTERWLAKARELATLDHRNIVHLFDVDLEGDRYFLVMEWVPGSNLTQQISQSGPLSFSNAADIARQIASGLAHAHALGLLHLSLGPDQVLIDPKGTVKLLDVGITSLQSQDVVGTKSQPAAKPASKSAEEPARLAFFESPESAAQAETDFRSDLFSLGRILYYALAGRTPDTKGPIPPITTVRPDTPEPLVQLIAKLTAADRSSRGGSAEEAEKVLVEYLKSAPKESLPVTPEKTTGAASGANAAASAEAKTVVASHTTPASPNRAKPVATTPGSNNVSPTQRGVDTPDSTKESDDPFNDATLAPVKSVYSSGSNPILAASNQNGENAEAQGSSASHAVDSGAGESNDHIFEIRVKSKKKGGSKSSPASSATASPSTASHSTAKAAVEKASVTAATSSAANASAEPASEASPSDATKVAVKPRSAWSRILLWSAVPLVGLDIGAGAVVLLLNRDSSPKPIAEIGRAHV